MSFKGATFLFAFIVSLGCVFGQENDCSIKGTITSQSGEALMGITVLIKNTSIGTATDPDGKFVLENLKPGEYQISFSGIGYVADTHTYSLKSGQQLRVNIRLEEDVQQVGELQVTAKSKAQEKREDPIKVEVIELQKVREQSSSAAQLINQTAGVKVRQSAGVGSPTLININGLQGRAIRFFRNGIPMDFMGRAFDLSLIPIDLVSNIEIYKGALPVELGADALGGGVDITTQDIDRNSLNMSYMIGSFNTHQANLVATYLIPKTKLYTSLSSSYIYSDNDYSFTGDVLDEETQNFRKQEVVRFHDAIQSLYLEGKIGLRETRWADIFELGISYFDWDKEIQNGVVLTTPAGDATDHEWSKIGSLQYKKKFDKLTIHAFGAYSRIDQLTVDTANNIYNWLGEVVNDQNLGGEAGDKEMYQILNNDNFSGRLYTSYDLHENHKLKASYTFIGKDREGSNPLGQKHWITQDDPLEIPAIYKRNIVGFGLGSKFLGDRLVNELTVKSYNLFTESASIYSWRDEKEILKRNTWGYGNSLKYVISELSFARVSYEKTTRIPESEEYFGDNLFIIGNPVLEPETSDNINLGFYSNLNRKRTLWWDVNLFYRFTQDLIMQRPYGFFNSIFTNTDNGKIKGVETTLKWQLPKEFDAKLVMTYQDMRRVDTESTARSLEGSRLPNTPYMFGNLNAQKQFKSIFKIPLNGSIYANYTFTEQFLLHPVPVTMEPGLFEESIEITEQVIPSQHQFDVGLTLKYKKTPFSFNFELVNLTNTELYDRFRIQKPGRFFRFKLNYGIKSKINN